MKTESISISTNKNLPKWLDMKIGTKRRSRYSNMAIGHIGMVECWCGKPIPQEIQGLMDEDLVEVALDNGKRMTQLYLKVAKMQV